MCCASIKEERNLVTKHWKARVNRNKYEKINSDKVIIGRGLRARVGRLRGSCASGPTASPTCGIRGRVYPTGTSSGSRSSCPRPGGCLVLGSGCLGMARPLGLGWRPLVNAATSRRSMGCRRMGLAWPPSCVGPRLLAVKSR